VFPSPCAEFPNDNPALYEARASVAPKSPDRADAQPNEASLGPPVDACEGAPGDEALELDLFELEDTLEGAPSGVPPDEASSTQPRDAMADPFTNLAGVLESVARDAGATDVVATLLRGLLGLERLEAASLPEASLEALVSGKQLERTAAGPRRSDVFSHTVRAWQDILRGDGEDLAACGPATLDEWTADLIARVLGNPVLATQLRRELRRRGVAAFGLVAEAA
jgi:hypothetical protein